MIKVITLTADAWDIGVYKTADENIDEDKRKYAYESSILNMFIKEGWNIVDWKMAMTKGPVTRWTFILEKKDE